MERLRGFDGMRAIACLAVLAHHLFLRISVEGRSEGFVRLRQAMLNGEVGVSLFFVLSGALLSLPFWTRYLDGRPAPSVWDYTRRRAARILPGYYCALAVSFLVGLWLAADAPAPWIRLLAGATMTSPYHYLSFFPTEIDAPLWSIGLEVSCYLVLPLLLLPLWRLPAGRRHGLALGWVLSSLVALQLLHLVILRVFAIHGGAKGWEYGLVGGAREWLPYWSPASFMTQFMLGSLLALAIAWMRREEGARSHVAFDLLAVVAAVFTVWLVQTRLDHGKPDPLTLQPYLAPAFAACCAVVLFGLQHGRWVHRVVDNRAFRFVAEISFGLYLWHFAVMEIVRGTWRPDYRDNGLSDLGDWLGLSVLVLAITFAIAASSYRWLESPVLARARRRSVVIPAGPSCSTAPCPRAPRRHRRA